MESLSFALLSKKACFPCSKMEYSVKAASRMFMVHEIFYLSQPRSYSPTKCSPYIVPKLC
jgi:hypothetical protein